MHMTHKSQTVTKEEENFLICHAKYHFCELHFDEVLNKSFRCETQSNKQEQTGLPSNPLLGIARQKQKIFSLSLSPIHTYILQYTCTCMP